jgi:DNA-binding MurR/RpiR family transcriptional regulator
MRPNFRAEIFDLPRALRENLGKGRREYDALIRRVPWGELPKTFIAPEELLPLAQFMAEAFQELLQWPCEYRSTAEALARPQGVHFLISGGGDRAEFAPLIQSVRAGKGCLLALATERGDPLAAAVDLAFAVSLDPKPGLVTLGVLRHAVAGLLAVLAARALKRPARRQEKLDAEFSQLPRHLEQYLLQRTAGVRSFASGLARSRQVWLAAGGGYSYAARSASAWLSRMAGLAAPVMNLPPPPSELPLGQGSAVAVLTGSRCRLKAEVIAAARQANRAGAEVFALTDGNDSELAKMAKMTLLLPPLDEITGSVMAHAVMAWAAWEASRLNLVGRKPDR